MWEERAGCHFLPRHFMPFISVYVCHHHRHKLISVGVVCQLFGIHEHVMLVNILVKVVM